MAATLLQIMQAIETRVDTIDGLRTKDHSPGEISPPCAIVAVPPVPTYHGTFGGAKFPIRPTITVLTGNTLDRVGQHKLAGYANPTGETSIKAAIEADKTLGGIVDDCFVVSFRPLGLEEVGAIGYFGGLFELSVQARGV